MACAFRGWVGGRHCLAVREGHSEKVTLDQRLAPGGELCGKGALGRGTSQGTVLRPENLILFKNRKKASVP